MCYIYSDAEKLEYWPLVGSNHCVPLVREFTHAPEAVKWREGAPVKGNLLLEKGTVIATFEGGKYPSRPDKKHAAFYIGQDVYGIWVIEQYVGLVSIQRRRIKFPAKGVSVSTLSPSNNGNAYSVVE
jgi:hypothetical protein